MVLGQHRVRHAVRKAPVGLVMNLDELERQVRLELVDDQPCAAIAGMHDDLERLQLRAIDVRQQVLDVAGHRRRSRNGRRSRAGCVNSPASAIARISCRPVSPLIGREPSRTNFMPL